MRVKCVLCDKIDKLDDQLPLAKRLRNRPIHTYMCDACNERIKVKTEARKEIESFQIALEQKEESDWL